MQQDDSASATSSSIVLLALGSNLGDRHAYLKQARQAIAGLPQTRIMKSSMILENAALLVTEQPDFLNQVLLCECKLDPYELLHQLQMLEQKLGRVRRFAKGPREIDLDILSHGHLLIHSPDLNLPHPGLKDRPYLHSLLADLGLDHREILESCQQAYR